MNIRILKFHLLICGMFTMVSGCQHIPSEDPNIRLPNIILIMSDDHGHGDLGFHGNPDIKTPVLDSLATLSTRFTQFYVSPVCAPTRASLMTGRYSIRTGVYDTYNGGAIMSSDELTIAEYLKKKGYICGVFGKWHLGDSYPFRPQDQGFDYTFVHSGGGIGQPGDLYENYIRPSDSYFDAVIMKNGKKIKTNGYCSDVFTDEMLRFIDTNQSRPFFAYLAFNAPHTPLLVPEKYYNMYENLEIIAERYPFPDHFPSMTLNDIEDARKVYGMVSNIDDNLGKILAKLTTSGLAANTLLIFITDNGPQQHRYVSGLRGRKGTVYEGGIRVPSFWYWPGVIEADKEINIPSAHFDVVPTIMDICGIATCDDNPFDGKSLWPLIQGKQVDWSNRTIVYHWTRGFPEPYHNIAVRKGPFKMVGQGDYRMTVHDFELYNLDMDPFESIDISKQNIEKTTELKTEFDNWYSNIMCDADFKIQRIIIGSEHENPVVLNRNDTKGPMAKKWTSPTAIGYWDIYIANRGKYDIKVVFFEKFKNKGIARIMTDQMQRSILNNDTTSNFMIFNDIILNEGPTMFHAWYEESGELFAPIFVELRNNDI